MKRYWKIAVLANIKVDSKPTTVNLQASPIQVPGAMAVGSPGRL
jgi:hypothetical protein